jgi:carbamoyl-phosphate synthase small subunit
MNGYLVLENGRVFPGKLLNDCYLAGGEVVFTTAMISYQDIITDPSYFGQIVVMTYPLIGNVGFNEKSFASRRAMLKGLVLREATDFPNHYEMETDLKTFLNLNEIPVLTEVDTRALTRELRNNGTMGGVITDNLGSIERHIQKAKKEALDLNGDLVRFVTRKNIMCFGEGPKRIIMLDLGSKKGAIDSFIKRGCKVIAVPATTNASEIMELKPDGVFFSDGPGNPEVLQSVIDTCRSLQSQVPVFGVGLGHQILALSLGAKSKRLKYGHRGTNHPVKDLRNGRVYITTQNHGYTIDEDSLKNIDLEIILKSLNDNTVEGIRHISYPAFSVQFDPEGFSGYSETGIFYDDFVNML